ncbi:hypothetical protein ACQ4PT_007227 [Festuca glaucescens]
MGRWRKRSAAGGRSSFEQGGPSGTAGHGGNFGNGAERSNDVFGDGIFRAGSGRPNNAGGAYRNQQGYNRGYNRSFGVEGFKAPTTHEENLSEDMHKDDDMDHDGPSNNSGDDIDREIKRKKNEEGGNDTDYEPSHPVTSAGTSLSVLPTTVSQEKITAAVDVSPTDVAVSEPADGVLANSKLGMTKLHEPGVVLPLVQRADRGLEGVGAAAGEAATPMHGPCTQGTSIAVGTGAPSLPVHGACSPGSGTTSIGAPIAPGTLIMLSTPVIPSTPILPPTLVSSPLAKVSSQHFMSEGSSSLPMESSKRTYVHMVKPKRSKSTVSPLPVSVHHMADGATKNNMTPVTINTPVSKAFSTEEATKLRYTSDAGFTDGGSNHNVSAEYIDPAYTKRYPQALNVRAFPGAARSCYTLPSTMSGSKYLIRAVFMYGNYDGLNRIPIFDIYLGVNFWDTLNFSTADTAYISEVIAVVPDESM